MKVFDSIRNRWVSADEQVLLIELTPFDRIVINSMSPTNKYFVSYNPDVYTREQIEDFIKEKTGDDKKMRHI